VTWHVPEDLLRSFVEGNVDEKTAIEVAEHIDRCPACSCRADAIEPLAAAFAAVADPVPPPELVQRVLDEVEKPEAVPTFEIGVGLALLAAAAVVFVLTGNPVAFAVKAGVLVDTLSTIGTKFALVGNASLFALSLSTVAATAISLVAARFALAEGRTS
jgi:anti-sigma factor RsiW